MSQNGDAWSRFKKEFHVARNSLWADIRAPGLWKRILLVLLQYALLLIPATSFLLSTTKRSYGIAYAVAALIFMLGKAWYSLSPKHMQVVQRGYTPRKLRLFKLIQQLQDRDTLTGGEVTRFQEDVLELIASYVRDHRANVGAPKIFANLLVEDGSDMLVVARDPQHARRHPGARAPKAASLAYRALQSGTDVVTGDIYSECPDTPPGKPYKSVMIMLVKLRGTPVGVVSVDSSKLYHFDRDFSELVVYLSPFVALLAWTLDPQRNGATGRSVLREGKTQ